MRPKWFYYSTTFSVSRKLINVVIMFIRKFNSIGLLGFALILPPLHRMLVFYDEKCPQFVLEAPFLISLAVIIDMIPISLVVAAHTLPWDVYMFTTCGIVLVYAPVSDNLFLILLFVMLLILLFVSLILYKVYKLRKLQSPEAKSKISKQNNAILYAILCQVFNPIFIVIPFSLVKLAVQFLDKLNWISFSLKHDAFAVASYYDYLLMLNPTFDAIFTFYFMKDYRTALISKIFVAVEP